MVPGILVQMGHPAIEISPANFMSHMSALSSTKLGREIAESEQWWNVFHTQPAELEKT
jgi:hypothetical protein